MEYGMHRFTLWIWIAAIIELACIGSASIDFVNETSVVAIGATDLHFETINPIENNQETIQWTILLSSNDNQVNLYFANYNFSSNKASDVIINEEYVLEAICDWYNETHFKSMLILGPMPADLIQISFTMLVGDITHNESLTSKYCPDLNETEYLNVYNDTKAVYNQQARFNCSKGELYDGSSMNPDYYRTCQFNATWSGEMPECWIEPEANITISNDPLISQQNVTFSCEAIDGFPELFDVTLSLSSLFEGKENAQLREKVTLPVELTPDMNGAELLCHVNNSYNKTIANQTLNVLFGPMNQTGIVFDTLEYGKQVIVNLTFTANPIIYKNTTNLTNDEIEMNTTSVNLTEYDIIDFNQMGGDFNQMLQWVIENFTEAHEGNYTFTAWSHVQGVVENIAAPFELKVGLSSIPATTAPETTVSPTSTGGSTSKSVTTSKGGIIGDLSLGLLIGIAAGGLAIIVAIIVVVILIIRRRKKPAGDTVLMNGEDLGNGRVDRTNILYDSNEFVEKEERTNPIYEAGGGATSSGGGDIYAQVNKRGKKNQGGDVYAQVNKQRKNNTDLGGDVYAQVNKNGKKGVNNDAYQQDPPAYAAAHNNE